jgi:hypothetical protein
MGLKGYRLWVMGQLDSTCRAPPKVTTPPETVTEVSEGCSSAGARVTSAV